VYNCGSYLIDGEFNTKLNLLSSLFIITGEVLLRDIDVKHTARLRPSFLPPAESPGAGTIVCAIQLLIAHSLNKFCRHSFETPPL
jgi:hypothetical protein